MSQFIFLVDQECHYYAHFCSCYTADLFETTQSERLTAFIACAIRTSKLHPGYALWALLILTRYRGYTIALNRKFAEEAKRLLQHKHSAYIPSAGPTIAETEQLFLAAYFIAAKYTHSKIAVLPFWRSLAPLIDMDYLRLRYLVYTIEKIIKGETSAEPNELCNMRILVEDAYHESAPQTDYTVSWWPEAEGLQLNFGSIKWEEPQLNKARIPWFRRWRKNTAQFLRICYVSIYLP